MGLTTNIIGLSAYYHDSAAVLLRDGEIVAAAQEERFTRIKHDPAFPTNALKYCLKAGETDLYGINHIVYYDKPLVKFERLLETYLAYTPGGIKSFSAAMPVWLKEKLFLKKVLRRELSQLSGIHEKKLPKLLFNEHHRSHAASAFYPSPFSRSAVLCLDGVGEWTTSSVWLGEGNQLIPQWEINFPHSLGLLYSAFTYYCGFKVNSGEYKLMGLAPYGEPVYCDLIEKKLLNIKEDGSFRLNMEYFDFPTGMTMINRSFEKLFGKERRKPESEVVQHYMDVASSIQAVTEKIILMLCHTIHAELNSENLCLAGGVALNCAANGRLKREGPFKNLWIQPAAGDAGGALGAALTAWHEHLGSERQAQVTDRMQGSYLGPMYSTEESEEVLDKANAKYEFLDDNILTARVVELLEMGHVIGWFQGRMEYGPRALGNRSILADPRNEKMQSVMNLKIKNRESFRPFAPAVAEEWAGDWFEMDYENPYMLIVAPVRNEKRIESPATKTKVTGLQMLDLPRTQIPAVTHVDYSARVQSVQQDTNPKFHKLIMEFGAKTGCPVLVNTSFNVRGEPIVCDVNDAYRCFMNTEMDYLVIGNLLLNKSAQPKYSVANIQTSTHEPD